MPKKDPITSATFPLLSENTLTFYHMTKRKEAD